MDGSGPTLNALLSFSPSAFESRFAIIEVQAGGAPVSGEFQGLPPNSQYDLKGQPYQVFYNQVNPGAIPATSGHNVVLQSLGFLAAYRPMETVTMRGSGVAGGRQYELPPAARTVTSSSSRPVENLSRGSEVAKEAERQVEVRVVTPLDDQGGVKETTVLKLPASALKDLAKLIVTLPDDRYRIYLIIQGGEQRMLEERLVRDVAVHDGRPLERSEAPPVPKAVAPLPKAGGQSPGIPGPGAQAPLPGTPAAEAPQSSTSSGGGDLDDARAAASAAWLPAGLAAGSTVGLWPTRVDQAVVRYSRQLLTKAARLVRRGRVLSQERLTDVEVSDLRRRPE